MNTRNLTVALLAVGTLAGVAGCGDSGAGATPAVTPSPTLVVPTESVAPVPSATRSVTPSATTTASTSMPSARPSVSHRSSDLPSADAQGAVQAVKTWKATLEQIYADPTMTTSKLRDVATGSALQTSEDFVKNMRGSGLHTSGATTWVTTSIGSAKVEDGINVVPIAACVDVSKLKVLDASGKDVTPKNRKPRVQENYLVSSAGGSSAWKVADISSTGAPC